MELYPNVHQTQSLFGGRNLFQYLFVGKKVVLVDVGCADTPEKIIFPYFDALKMKPERLTMAITTHADLDHQGGNHAIKRVSPRTWIACGEADRAMVENPQVLFDRRYNYLQEEHSVGFGLDLLPHAGQPLRVDISFGGGERILLKDDWVLEVLHVPGHSHGHLALYDATRKAAFVGDAIHGRGCPKAGGPMAIPVTYYYVDLYLSTLRYFEVLDIDVLYSGHWPTMRGEEIKGFVFESRQTVEVLDRAILDNLAISRVGLTLKELVDVVAHAIGAWPKDSWLVVIFSVNGHMERLEQCGKVRRVVEARPSRWQLA